MDPKLGSQLAVLVGIDSYGQGIPRLKTPVHDVTALGQLLGNLHGYEVRYCLNEEATGAGLRELLEELTRQIAEADRVFFYFAGHGIALDGEDGPRGYFIPADGRRDDLLTFLPMSDVQALMAKLQCRHFLMVLDCCFAGAFRWSSTRNVYVKKRRIYRESYQRYLRDPAWQVITSAAHDEMALDVLSGYTLGQRGAVGGHSPFALALMEGLRGGADLGAAGEPGDGLILASELHVFLEAAMRRLEVHTDRDQQRPMLWSWRDRSKGEFLFHVPGRQPLLPSALALTEKNNPYRGLEPYEEEHRELFFGRNRLGDALYQHVIIHPLSVVVGASGSGKSSLVRAGLIPRLRKTQDAVWQVLPILRPGNDPMGALRTVKVHLGAPPEQTLSQAVAGWLRPEMSHRTVLIVDQLEELVTLAATPLEREQFLDELVSAIRARQLHVVTTLRVDFEPHFARLFQQCEEAASRFLVRPMEREELREAIERPASERALTFAPTALVDLLIDEVIDMPGGLPLLSFVLSEMYRAYIKDSRDDRALCESDYTSLGGVTGALSRRADEVRNSLDEVSRKTLDRVMLRMVALQIGEVARRRVYLKELDHGPSSAEQARIVEVLRKLQDARLVVADQDASGESYVEPAHDKLVLGWQHLWNLLLDVNEELQLHRRMTQSAFDWDLHGRTEHWLWYADPRLAQALLLWQRDAQRFNAIEVAFLASSQKKGEAEAERERIRMTELQVARDQAVKAKEEAEAEAQRAKLEARRAKDALRVSSASLLDETSAVTTKAALLRDVVAKEETRGWEQAARMVLDHRPLPLVVLRGSRRFTAIAFNPDGTRLVTGSEDGTATLWRVDGRGDPCVLRGHKGSIRTATFSPDDRSRMAGRWLW